MTRKTASTTTTDRRAMIDDLRERVESFAEDTDDATLAMITAQWDGYSPRNAMLIAMQCPGATDVSGYGQWRSRGRQVRKGEHGIAILAPAGHADDQVGDDGKVEKAGRQFFKAAYVFDVSQTDEIEGTS